MRRLSLIALLLSLLAATAAPSGQVAALHYLVGDWTCTYDMGTTHMTYASTYAYYLGGNWMRQRTKWPGGGGDEETVTYDPKRNLWTAVVLEGEGTTTIFTATGSDPNHLTYHSVYPDASMTEKFDRISVTKYTLHFKQNAGGKIVRSVDLCVKNTG
jgi:hypothetical protein